ncbi:MAG: SulP family inorganic anion transporter [Planctomycetota bacterium]|jgi:SulP family sulfate permease
MKIIKSVFPFLNWLPLKKNTVKADLISGLTVAMVLIPQSMAYAQLANLPPYYGLYAAFIPGIIGAMWGSSHHLATGPVAMTSLLTATALAGIPGVTAENFIDCAILMALIVGIIRILIGLFKLTFVLNFLSQPVIRGFTNAGALIIAASQVSKIFGIKMQKSDFFMHDIWKIFTDVPHMHVQTFIIGIVSIAIIYLLKKYKPAVPSALVVAVLGSLVVWGFDLSNFDAETSEGLYSASVKVVGAIPEGLPAFKSPAWDTALVVKMLPGALVVMFIGFMEVCSVSKAISAKSKQNVDLNRELIGQGLSAIAGSFTQCYPTSGSFSRSALNYSAGGKTGMSSVFAGAFVLITLLFLTKFLFYLPQATLAAIIIMAVIGLVDFKAIGHAWRVSKFDGAAAAITFAATMLCAPYMVNGIIIGGLLALCLHLYSTMKPRAVILGKDSDGTLRDADLHKLEPNKEMPAIRFDGRLYFANVSYFQDVVLKAANRFEETKAVVVFGEGINAIDASGEAILRDVYSDLKDTGIKLAFVGIKTQIDEVLQRSGLKAEIGSEFFYKTESEMREKLPALL